MVKDGLILQELDYCMSNYKPVEFTQEFTSLCYDHEMGPAPLTLKHIGNGYKNRSYAIKYRCSNNVCKCNLLNIEHVILVLEDGSYTLSPGIKVFKEA